MDLYTVLCDINDQLNRGNTTVAKNMMRTFRHVVKQYLRDYRFPEEKLIRIVVDEIKKIDDRHPELVNLVYSELVDLLCFHSASMVKAIFRHELLQD